MSVHNSLQFGVEVELLLGSRKKAHSSWKGMAKDLSKRLAMAGISNHVNEGNDKSQEHYNQWSIVQEVTIPSQPGKGLWGIELVSPIYMASWYWATDLETIFSVLRGSFVLAPSLHCSTHVHVSGNPVSLNSFELATLAKAALYFEPALDALVPPNRRSSAAYWCQSNRANPTLSQISSVQDCFAIIDHAVSTSPSLSDSPVDGPERESTRAVVEAMNLFPANSAYGKAHGKKKDFIRGKIYKWDFTGMLPRGKGESTPARGTVEYRQAPGSMSAEEAKGWITLALCFVAGVTVSGFTALDGMEGACINELWDLLKSGADVLGWNGLGAVEGIFAMRLN